MRITPGTETIGLVDRLERGTALDGVPPLLRQGRYFDALDLIVGQLERLSEPKRGA